MATEGKAGVNFRRSKTRGNPTRKAKLKRRAVKRDGRGQRSGRTRRAASLPASADVEVQPLDSGVIASTAILAGIGILMVYSSTAPLAIGSAVPPHFLRHCIAVAIGVSCIAVVLRIPIALWLRLALPLWGLGVALLLATAIAGVEVNGARRWLALPGIGLRLQAAEFVKWATVLAIAVVTFRTHERRSAPGRPLVLTIGLIAAPVGLLLAQPDFGSAAVLIALAGLLLFVAGTPLRYLLLPAGGAGLLTVAYIATHEYARRRLTGFLDPWATAHQEGFQLVQSFVAFGRGGNFGVGIGDGRQKLFYLPEAHTDFVLSVVAEELGFIGVLVVLGAFVALVVAGTRIAARALDPFCQILAFGMTALIAVPAAVNAAVVMGLIPTTGFTLPFISFGANSLILCCAAIGILLRTGSREVRRPRKSATNASSRGLLRA
jgi:cell division protein FtsW